MDVRFQQVLVDQVSHLRPDPEFPCRLGEGENR